MLFLRGTAAALLLCSVTAMAQSTTDAACPRPGMMETIVRGAMGARRMAHVGYGYAIIDGATGRTRCEDSYEADRQVYPASTIKTLVAVAVLREVDAGRVHRDQTMTVSAGNTDGKCLGCRGMGAGNVVTVGELLSAMQIHSSNVATNQLIDLVGKPLINATADLLGAPTLRVYRKLYTDDPVEPDNPQRNEATVRGYIALYREIATGAGGVLSESSRAHLVDLLAHCHAHNRLNKEFPAGVTFYHKTGSTSDSSSDAGYYHLPSGEVAILVGLQDFRDFRPLVRVGRALFGLL